MFAKFLNTFYYLFFPAGLKAKVNELYKRTVTLEEEKYDWELKIRRQDFEVRHLHQILIPDNMLHVS